MTTTQNLRTELSSRSCIICHELNPNITTLCCLTPVHLACLNKWTDVNPNCMVCRSKLLPNATNNPAARTTQLSENNSLDINYYYESSEEEEEEEERYDIRFESYMDDSEVEEEGYNDRYETHMEDSSSTSSEDNDYPDEESEIEIEEEEEDDYNIEDGNNSDYSVHSSREQIHHPSCIICRNKAAASCVKQMCGTCCRNDGIATSEMWNCERHKPRTYSFC